MLFPACFNSGGFSMNSVLTSKEHNFSFLGGGRRCWHLSGLSLFMSLPPCSWSFTQVGNGELGCSPLW